MTPASPLDFRAKAKRNLPHFLFEYLDGGALDEVTLQNNLKALRDINLRQRVLKDVSHCDLSCEWFGVPYDMPIALGPIGLAGMNARRGETLAVKAANKANIAFCLSSVSVCSLDEVARAASHPYWFQLYVMRDRGLMRDLLQSAKDKGCGALVLTLDMAVPGIRYRDQRSGLAGAPGFIGDIRRLAQALIRPRWAIDVGLLGGPHTLGNVAPIMQGQTGLEDFFAWMRNNFDPSVTWKDVDLIRSLWDGPLIIKGILDQSDAAEALNYGIDAMVVSNHGGRQLDSAIATACALPKIKQIVEDRVTLFVDGGVRNGLDVVKMLSLGADGVFLGRAWAYALAAEGQGGVTHLLELIKAEMRIVMALCGVTRIAEIDGSCLSEHLRP